MKNQSQGGGGREPEVTLESIDASLRELVKAADATDLVKGGLSGVSVEDGGHTDERGNTSGGYPGTGDIGGLDSMMVGKMQTALIDAGFDAGSIAAFMRGKAFGPPEDDSESEDDADEQPMAGKFGKPADASGETSTAGRPRPAGGKSGKGKMGKSADYFRNHQNEAGEQPLADAMDVSPFLREFVTAQSELLDDLQKSIDTDRAGREDVTRRTAVVLMGLGQMLKSLIASNTRLEQRLGTIERQPMPQKGATMLPGGGQRPRALSKGLNEAGGSSPDQLTKPEMISVLSYLNLEKSQNDPRYRQIGGQATHEVIGMYEGGGQLSRAAYETVHRFLATHPNEAEVARNYR